MLPQRINLDFESSFKKFNGRVEKSSETYQICGIEFFSLWTILSYDFISKGSTHSVLVSSTWSSLNELHSTGHERTGQLGNPWFKP